MSSIFDSLVTALLPIAVSALRDQATVRRRVRVRIAGGGITDTWDPVATYTNIPCRLANPSLSQTEFLTADQLVSVNRWVVSFTRDTVILEGDQITVNGTFSDGSAWTKVLHALGSDGPHSFEVTLNVAAIDPSMSGR